MPDTATQKLEILLAGSLTEGSSNRAQEKYKKIITQLQLQMKNKKKMQIMNKK